MSATSILAQFYSNGKFATAVSILSFFAFAAQAKAGEGYLSLFDGKSLDKWVHPRAETIDKRYRGGEWEVVDGAIVGRQKPRLVGSFLHTEQKFQDFDLVIDFMVDWGCDSGIFIHTTAEGKCIQIFVDYLPGGNIGFLFGQGSGGYASKPWELEAIEEEGEVVGVRAVDCYDGVEVDGLVYSAKAEAFNKVWRHGEFNTLRIRCMGENPNITTWLNGEKMMEMDGSKFRARFLPHMNQRKWDASPAWDRKKMKRITGGKGTIGLQVHPEQRWNGVARFKNIRIQEL